MNQFQKRQTLQEFVAQWQSILKSRGETVSATPRSSASHQRLSHEGGDNDDTEDEEDPFECHSLTVPPTHALADAVADHFVQQWRELDKRKIAGTAMGGGVDDESGRDANTLLLDPPEAPHHRRPWKQHKGGGGSEAPTTTTTESVVPLLPRWYEKHVRLPEHFDYASIQPNPPSLHDTNDTGSDRVVSLEDPLATTSYHAELWHSFHSIPSAAQLEAEATAVDLSILTSSSLKSPLDDESVSADKLPNGDRTVRQATIEAALSATRALHAEMDEARQFNSAMDGHALSRLRMNDRHDPLPMGKNGGVIQQQHDSMNDNIDRIASWDCTMRWECVRQQFRRTSTPDLNRMVLEFRGSQTLLDFHTAIVELTHDELFAFDAQRCQNRKKKETVSATAGECEENVRDSSQAHKKPDLLPSSGFFFIEDTFYTTGPVDYIAPILEWLLSDGTDRDRKRRLLRLGIEPTNPKSFSLRVKDMSLVGLDEISCRLGIRYVHVHNGDVECAVFVTDRRLLPTKAVAAAAELLPAAKNNAAEPNAQFPILHDVWSPSYAIPECDVCQTKTVSVATSTNCEITLGHRALCATCCRRLNLPVKAQFHILPYSVWRGQADVSAGASGETSW